MPLIMELVCAGSIQGYVDRVMAFTVPFWSMLTCLLDIRLATEPDTRACAFLICNMVVVEDIDDVEDVEEVDVVVELRVVVGTELVVDDEVVEEGRIEVVVVVVLTVVVTVLAVPFTFVRLPK